jgi:hypothetical protein
MLASTPIFADNTSYTNGGETYAQERNNINNTLQAKHQSDQEYQLELINIAHARDAYWKATNAFPLPTLNSSKEFVSSKLVLAQQETHFPPKHYWTNYDYLQQDHLASILLKLRIYNSELYVPAFAPCQSFHACNLQTFYGSYIPSPLIANTTSTHQPVPIKPEFSHNPTGYQNSTSLIKNFHDLQNFLTQNSTKK